MPNRADLCVTMRLSATMVLVALALICLVCLEPAFARTCDSQRDVTVVEGKLNELIRRMQSRIYDVVGKDQDGRPYYTLVPSFVRLAFHVCSANWCSSRIDFSNRLNRGLELAVLEADSLWQELQLDPYWTGFSKADVYALYAVAAIEIATDFKIRVPFRYGRPDFCPGDDPSKLEQTLPSRNLDTNSLFAFMERWLRLTPEETVVIMGAHSLGVLRDSALPPQPAFRWVQGAAHSLSNEYYQKLLHRGWHQVDRKLSGARVSLKQWETTTWPRLLMLNADMSIVRNLVATDAKSGTVQCTTYDSCPKSDWADTVKWYADSNNVFLKDFSRVFGKMIENGLSEVLVAVTKDNVAY